MVSSIRLLKRPQALRSRKTYL